MLILPLQNGNFFEKEMF
uniref:Uncharacterized protein n=1 Tax=Arundo donax TaxID=35708 RepID=A0A0A9GZ06_ARUDO